MIIKNGLMNSLYIPKNYKNLLGDSLQTEKAIKVVKDMFQTNLASQLSLLRVTAPMFVMSGTGLNDDLNGVEKPVSFTVPAMGGCRAEIVHSLAKWKRYKLGELRTPAGMGLYTDMNAIRPEENLDNIHSIYVDQWDWERVITPEERNFRFLKKMVKRIYAAIKVTENRIYVEYPQIRPILPEKIFFIHAEELRQRFPELTPKQREIEVAREYGAVFISGIGCRLGDGSIHDSRSADYDDWSTEGKYGLKGLNGDIILWNPILESAFEVSSMGIRVDAEALKRQLKEKGEEHKMELLFHRMLLNGQLPLTIGGGIGQSRLCMFLLRKAHIGEIQSSLWPEDMVRSCREAGIEI